MGSTRSSSRIMSSSAKRRWSSGTRTTGGRSQACGTDRRHRKNQATLEPEKPMETSQKQAALSERWRQWAIEKRLLGMGDAQISATLTDRGIDARTVVKEIHAMVSHPSYRVA